MRTWTTSFSGGSCAWDRAAGVMSVRRSLVEDFAGAMGCTDSAARKALEAGKWAAKAARVVQSHRDRDR